MKFENGFKFMDTIRDYEIIDFLPQHNMYLLNNTTDNRKDELMKETEIQSYVDRVDEIKIKREKNRIFLEKQEHEEKLQQEKQEAEGKEYNNTYGFCNEMKAIQKGKVLKILNTTENYYSNGEYVGTIKRKDFIKNTLEAGGHIEHKTDLKYYTKNCELKIKTNEYRLYCFNETSFYEINKTEYKYAMYLIDIIKNVRR